MNQTYSATIIELKDKILSLAASCPKGCSLGISRLFQSKKGILSFALVCDYVGLDYAEQVFESISVYQWNVIKDTLRASLEGSAEINIAQAMLDVYQDLLGESMDQESISLEEDPFYFLREMDQARLASVLRKENPVYLAFLSIYWSQAEVAELLKCLDHQIKKEVILHISRLSRIPTHIAGDSAKRYASTLQGKFRVKVTGIVSSTVKEIITSTDLTAEEKFFQVILPKSEKMKEKWNIVRALHEESLRLIEEAKKPTLSFEESESA